MSRWFIEEYSDENEEESIGSDEFQIETEDTTPHEVPEEIPLDYFVPKLNPNNEKKGQNQANSKQSNVIECWNLLDSILQNIDNNQIQKSHTEFNKLQDVYKQVQKDFKKNYIPNFIIKKLFEINQKITEQSKSNKQARQFQKDLKKFNRNFEKELSEFEQHPENFQNEDEIEFKDEIVQKSDDDFYLSSSDEEEEEETSRQSANNANKRKGKICQSTNNKNEVKRANPTANANAKNGKKEEESTSNNANEGKQEKNADNSNSKNEEKEGESSVNNADNKKEEESSLQKANSSEIENDDESIREVLRKYVAFKTNIVMKTDIDYLFTYYQNVKDPKLARSFQLEICYAASHIPNWQKVSYRNIPKILDFLPDLVGYAKSLILLFGKFNDNLTFYSTKLSTPSRRYHFYRMIHKFVNAINNFKQKLLEINEYKLYARLNAMFIGYMYCNEKYDISPQSLSMFEVLQKNIFSKAVTENYMYQNSLFYAFNLALRKNIDEAVEALNKIQDFNSHFFSDSQNVYLLTRALTQVGFSAFDECRFRQAYECFSKLITLKLLNENNLVEKITYPQLPSIECNSVIVRYILSAIVFNFPNIVAGINDEPDDDLSKNKNKIAAFFESLNPEEKQVLVTKYFILLNLVNYSKTGDWKSAYALLLSNFGNILSNRDEFLVVVKKLLLCSFLLSYKNTTIKVNSLETKFKMDKESIFEIVINMIAGFGPIGNSPILFSGQISEDKKTIQINEQKTSNDE